VPQENAAAQQQTHPPTSPSLLPTIRRVTFDCCGLQLFAVAFSHGTDFTVSTVLALRFNAVSGKF